MIVNRHESEKRFFDKTFEKGTRAKISQFYSIAQGSRDYYKKFLKKNCYGNKILEYGCGPGSYAFYLAKNGAEVVGIDISEVAIKQANEMASKENLNNIEFIEMDAENMTFEKNTFDIICGTGILHHLDLTKAMSELARVLKPDGKAIFIEPLGHNPGINLFRKLTPKMRTEDEHPLMYRDLEYMNSFFGNTERIYFNLFSLFSLLFWKNRNFNNVLTKMDSFDHFLFQHFPIVRRLAWQLVIILKNPK